VPQSLAAIAIHQNIFIIKLAAALAWLIFIFVVWDFEEKRGVKVRNLGARFNFVGGEGWTYTQTSAKGTVLMG
jgi:hypothetical protein